MILNYAALLIFFVDVLGRVMAYVPRLPDMDMQAAALPLLYEFTMTLWQPLILLALARLIQTKETK